MEIFAGRDRPRRVSVEFPRFKVATGYDLCTWKYSSNVKLLWNPLARFSVSIGPNKLTPRRQLDGLRCSIVESTESKFRTAGMSESLNGFLLSDSLPGPDLVNFLF